MGQIQVEKNVGGIEGLCVITPAVHGDARGYFMETYNQRDMEEAGFHIQFVQDNQSRFTGTPFSKTISAMQAGACRPGQRFRCSRRFAQPFPDIREMVWRNIDRRQQKTIPDS